MAREIHGGGEKVVEGNVYVGGGFGALREAIKVWNRDGVEGDEVRRV